MIDANTKFKFGTIFKMSYREHGEADFYMLVVPELGTFYLVNLRTGGKMSAIRSYDGGKDVRWSDIHLHAGYFIRKGCKLQPLEGCSLEYDVRPMPVLVTASGTAPIGR